MEKNFYYQGPVTDHFDGIHFFHPDYQYKVLPISTILRWKWQTRSLPKWKNVPHTTPIIPAASTDALTVTSIGHASMLIQCAGWNILVDPVWSERVSPIRGFGPRRWNCPGIGFNALPKIDIVLISHNHYDHLDTRTLAKLQKAHAPYVIAPLGNDKIISKAIPGMKTIPLDWWESTTLGTDCKLRISLTPAYHWSARGLRDRCMALWGGFYIHSPLQPIYIAGDTAFGEGRIFGQIRQQLGPPDVALLPIGAYAPRPLLQTMHMNPEEAVKAMELVGAEQALGVHWGTFRLSDEEVFDPCKCLSKALEDRQYPASKFRPIAPGQSITFANSPKDKSSPMNTPKEL